MRNQLFIKAVLSLLIIALGHFAMAQGNFKYHYIVPPDLGDRMEGIKKIAFLDFKYTPPIEEGAVEVVEEYDAGDELVKIMIEKQKKELLGEEEYNRLQSAKRSSDGGNIMGGALISNMTSILLIPDRGKTLGFKFLIEGMRTDVYTIVDRATIDKVLSEQQFQLSGVVDGEQMSEIGMLLGADAIVTGDLVSTKTDERLDERREEVKKAVKYTDDEGEEKTKYVLDYYKYVYPVRRTVTTALNIQVVSVKTGEVLGTKAYTETASNTKERTFKRARPSSYVKKYPNYSELQSADALIRKTINPLSQSGANLIAPRFGAISMKISKVKAKEFKKIAKEAAVYLKQARLEKAYAMYKNIYDADPYITEAAFNLGMIYEATGQYEKALEYYEAARESAVKNSNEKKYTQAIDRAEKDIEVLELMAALDVKLEKQYFSDAGGASLMAEKAQTKGNPKKDRFNVYEKADDSSAIIGKVPGGRGYPMFSVEGDWTLIEIVGGKKGYIENKNLK